ncbi:hypothetical protein PG984_011880 [Apiospora sp. TS-2023a]
MLRPSIKRAQVGLVRLLQLRLGALGIFITILLIYPISQSKVITEPRPPCVERWAEESLPPCQSAVGIVMDDIDKAAGTFARALMSVNEYSEQLEAMRLANMEALALSDSLRRMAKRGRDVKVTRLLADEYSHGLWQVRTSWDTMSMRLRLHGSTMERLLSSLQPEVDALDGLPPKFRSYAQRLGDPGSYYLGHYSEYMSLEDQLYFVLAMTIRVFNRVEPIAAETQGNATALLATLGRLREALEREHYSVQFDQKELRGGGLYVCNRANLCGLTGPIWVSAAELRGVETELVEAQQKLQHALELVTDVSVAAGDIRDGARENRDKLALAQQDDISLAGRTVEKDIRINSKRWRDRLEQRVAQISELREQLSDKDRNKTMVWQSIDD